MFLILNVRLCATLATPRFYLAAVEKISPWLQGKIWEWPENEARVS